MDKIKALNWNTSNNKGRNIQKGKEKLFYQYYYKDILCSYGDGEYLLQR